MDVKTYTTIEITSDQLRYLVVEYFANKFLVDKVILKDFLLNSPLRCISKLTDEDLIQLCHSTNILETLTKEALKKGLLGVGESCRILVRQSGSNIKLLDLHESIDVANNRFKVKSVSFDL